MSPDEQNEKTESLLNDIAKEESHDSSNTNENNEVDEQHFLTCWKRVPGMGLILIVLKNLLGGVSDSVAKKIENIGR